MSNKLKVSKCGVCCKLVPPKCKGKDCTCHTPSKVKKLNCSKCHLGVPEHAVGLHSCKVKESKAEVLFKLKAWIVIHPKTGRPENGERDFEISHRKLLTQFPKEEVCVPCTITYKLK